MWTDERIEILQRLWVQGLSASQIADQLQGVSRNAVIGKIYRLGKRDPSAAVRARPPAFAIRAARRQSPLQSRRNDPGEGALETVDTPRHYVGRTEEPGLATCATLDAHMCKWPIGNPDESGFSFCGRPSEGERPYCQGHAQLAYRGAKGAAADIARQFARYF